LYKHIVLVAMKIASRYSTRVYVRFRLRAIQTFAAMRAGRRSASWNHAWEIFRAERADATACVRRHRAANTAANHGRTEMNKDQVEGVGKQVKGKINEGVGKVTGDTAQEAKGDLQQAAGKVQKGVGDAREDLKDTVKKNP